MNIPMFAPVYDVETCIKGITDCLKKGWTGQGYKTIEFEDAWKDYTGLPHAHFITTATAGLNLAVETLKEVNNWQDEDEIISTPFTFVASNNAILFAKLKPVFADVDETLCLNPEEVEKNITEKTRAVLFVGLGGNIGRYYEVVEICRKYNLKLILDAAHMAGTRVGGIMPGKEADVVIYSYHVTKNLSLAEGGMICFKDEELDAIVKNKTFNGIDKSHSAMHGKKLNTWDYDVKYLADNYSGNSIMASIGLAQLPHLDEENRRRREIAKLYDRKFAKCPNKIKLVSIPDNCESARWLYQIIIDDRDGLLQHMMEMGVGCGIHYPDNTTYWMYKEQAGKCRKSKYYSEHILSLPLHIKLTDSDVIKIADEVIQYLGD